MRFLSDFDSVDGLFSKEAEINLYRIVQESIDNVVKHSAASEVRLAVKRDSRSLQIRIQDNGRGFDFPEARIVIVTHHDEPDFEAAACDAGACGYVVKDNLLELRGILTRSSR